MQNLTLRTLGTLRLEPSDYRGRKPLLLLSYLVLAREAKHRSYLAELFWSEAADGLNSLSNALTQLRGVLGSGCILADEERVALNLASDVQAFQAALEAAEYERATALYEGAFLEPINPHKLSQELEEWVLETRDTLEKGMQSSYAQLAEGEAAENRFEGAAERVETALKLSINEPEPNILSRYYSVLVAAEHPLAAKLAHAAAEDGILLEQSSEEARQSLRRSFVGRKRERDYLETLNTGSWVWLRGAAGMGKTSLLKTLSGTYLPARSGLPYASLEPVLEDTLTQDISLQSETRCLRDLQRQTGTWLVDDWERVDAESQALLGRLAGLRTELCVVIAARAPAALTVHKMLELAPLSAGDLNAYPGVWEQTGGIPALVGAFLRKEPLELALKGSLSSLEESAQQVYLALALLDKPDLVQVRKGLELSQTELVKAHRNLTAAGFLDASANVRARPVALA